MLTFKNIILLIILFAILGYTLNNYFNTNKIIEGNRKRCGKKKAWCAVKKKCISIWNGRCDAKM